MKLGVVVAAAAVGALHFVTRARAPQGWDEVGFVRAVERFDLAVFQPHFPGYPVYVALCKLAGAPQLVSAIASAATALALARVAAWLAARGAADARAPDAVDARASNAADARAPDAADARASNAADARASNPADARASNAADARAGDVAAFVAIALWAGALQPWLVGGAALADATAVAFVAAAFAALTYAGARATLLGAVAIALAVGTRLSYWPLALSYALVVARARPSHRRAALAGAAVATAAWLLPFVAAVGARRLWSLGVVHVAGHFGEWGGSVATRPALAARAVAFARDLVYDGIWPSPWLLALALALAALTLVRAPRPSPRARAVAASVVVPYAAWAFVAQNVVEQPRHLVPLVAALIVALAAACARRPLAGASLVALAFAASAPLVAHRAPPAAVVLAHRLAAAYPARDDVVVFARRSARLMQWAEPGLHVETRDRVSEVLGALERLSVLPRHIFVTDELTADDPARLSVAHGSLRFCRELRVDRQSPCLALRSYNLQP